LFVEVEMTIDAAQITLVVCKLVLDALQLWPEVLPREWWMIDIEME